MKNLFLPIAGVLVFIVIIGIGINKIQSSGRNKITFTKMEIKVGQTSVQVEIADTDEKRKLGLGNRESLGTHQGMLFPLSPKDTRPSFWMKDMKIPLDILWINDDTIVQIDQNVPAPDPGTNDKQLKLYYPKTPVDYVLEVNANFCKTFFIHENDPVDLSAALPK